MEGVPWEVFRSICRTFVHTFSMFPAKGIICDINVEFTPTITGDIVRDCYSNQAHIFSLRPNVVENMNYTPHKTSNIQPLYHTVSLYKVSLLKGLAFTLPL